jgi:thioredoxin-related protein
MPEIEWGNNLNAALKSAVEENKLLFIAFANPDCKMCMKMEESTLSEDQVKDYFSSKFMLLKFRSSKNPEKYLRLKVTETPTYVVMDTNGRELLRLTGYVSAEDLIGKLQNACS